jgi:hypothetical protein
MGVRPDPVRSLAAELYPPSGSIEPVESSNRMDCGRRVRVTESADARSIQGKSLSAFRRRTPGGATAA